MSSHTLRIGALAGLAGMTLLAPVASLPAEAATAAAATVAAATVNAATVAAATAEASVAQAQGEATVSTADVQRLQDRVFTLSGDLSRLRSRDAALASRLENELDDLRDEVVYLKVKLRKEGRVPRSEYTDLRDRLDNLGTRARAEGPASTSSSGSGASSSGVASSASTTPVERSTSSSGTSSAGTVSGGTGAGATSSESGTSGGSSTAAGERRPTAPGYGTSGAPSADPTVSDQSRSSRTTEMKRITRQIPVGQELDIRLQTPLNSATAQVEDRFEATTIVDMLEGEQVLVPAGTVLRGVVSSVKKAGRLERKGTLTLSFDQMTVDGRDYPIRATVTQAIESSGVRGEAGRIGAGAGVGAIIGGILGGFKGALAGILIGGGGTIAATEGTDVKLDTGTILRIRFDSPVTLESATPRR